MWVLPPNNPCHHLPDVRTAVFKLLLRHIHKDLKIMVLVCVFSYIDTKMKLGCTKKYTWETSSIYNNSNYQSLPEPIGSLKKKHLRNEIEEGVSLSQPHMDGVGDTIAPESCCGLPEGVFRGLEQHLNELMPQKWLRLKHYRHHLCHHGRIAQRFLPKLKGHLSEIIWYLVKSYGICFSLTGLFHLA